MTQSTKNAMLLRLNEASLQREKFEERENKIKRIMSFMAAILIVSISIIIGCQLFRDSSIAYAYNLQVLSRFILKLPYFALVFGVGSMFWLVRCFLIMISLEPETNKARKFEALLIQRVYHIFAANSGGNYNF